VEEAVNLQPLADSLEREGRSREAECAREKKAEGRGAVGAEQCAIVTANSSTGMVPLSIVNYVVYHSNGGAFECGGNQEEETRSTPRRRCQQPGPGAPFALI
jgi:hypothetical protein